MRNVGIGLLAAWLVSVPGAAAQETAAGVDIRVARFYRGGDTWVDGFCRVPFTGMQPLPARTDGSGAYVVSVTVRDSSGLELHRSGWSQDVPQEMMRLEGAHSVEHFSFLLRPGTYDLEIVIRDSSSGTSVSGVRQIRAYDVRPLASDLLLSTDMRRGGAGDTVTAPGEVRKGAIFLSAATVPALRLDDAQLYYYLELYPDADAAIELRAQVLGSDGRALVETQPAVLNVQAPGGVAASGLDLTGLPPGEFRLSLTTSFPDTTATRTATFAVGEYTAGIAADVAGAPAEEDRFGSLAEVQLDSLYAPLLHLQESDELNVYGALSVEAKRNYLRDFWARRDPTPGRPGNPAMDDFYGRVQEANRRFREGGAAETPGWRTDRGRIFIRYGEPATVLREPVPGGEYPWEVWTYATGRGRKFVFVDETGFDNFILVYTDEIREPSRPDWRSYFSAQDLRRIEGF